MTNQREEFEAAISRSLYALIGMDGLLCDRMPDGDYRKSIVQAAWWGYQMGGAGTNRLEEEADRQLVLLALANLALLRPGFDHALQTLSGRFGVDGVALFEHFKNVNRFQVGAWPYPPSGDAKLLPLRRTGEGGDE